MKQLIKFGKRRCYICKEIKEVSQFRERRYDCRSCEREKLNKIRDTLFNGLPIKKRIILKLGAKCKHCGITSKDSAFFDLDHIIPRRRKSLKEASSVKMKNISNLQVLCPNCHRTKTIQDRKNEWKQKNRPFPKAV